ncbi:response regulator [Novosphingobium sp.]|uniref:sensor histidine kinase n=1 Tax=Novosphingobium sp. TaxID=1874826 RepID=UPI003D131B01
MSSDAIEEQLHALRGANAELREIDTLRATFFSNLSHEFRTPMTLMLGPLREALTSREGALKGEALRMVQHHAQRLMHLVDAMVMPQQAWGAATFESALLAQAAAFTDDASSWSDPARAQSADTARRGQQAPQLGRILVVDDNVDLRAYLVKILSPYYAVDTAPDGAAALESIKAQRPDLILTDTVMPNLDGMGLLRAVRRSAELRQIPVILLSARAGGDASIDGLEAGADDYLGKPFVPRELLARVRTHVEAAWRRNVFERFFTLSIDMMCIIGSDGYFRGASPAFASMGYNTPELLALQLIELVHVDDQAHVQRLIDMLTENAEPIRWEARVRNKSGAYLWLSWSAARDGAGSVYAVARDITDTRSYQNALAAAKDAAEAANRELESFSYSVAHDLRAPLRSIDGFSQALQEDCAERLGDDGNRHLSYIRESAQKMAQLIDGLLALARLTRSEMHVEEVDLSELAQAAVARLQQAHPGRQVNVAIEPHLDVQADARLAAVVLDNLVGNAWKFTGKVATGRIEVGAIEQDGKPTYYVRDNGAGFDMSFANKLFGVFQRLHSVSEFEGNGVGLATVQRVVTRHGGRIWAESAVNQGTTFYFTFHDRTAQVDDGH